MQSVVTFEKPVPHLTLPDWDARLYNLQVTADTRRADAFNLRHSARQVRNETRIKAEWDTYHNNNRLQARIYEIQQWKSMIQELLERIDHETGLLKEEKAATERELEALNLSLLVCAESLSNRDGRRSSELTYDRADTELKKELCITENNKKMLTDRCQAAWEKINKLEAVKFKLQLNLNDKNEAISIDKDNLSLDNNCANITFKTDALKTPKRMITGQQWNDEAEATKNMAIAEMSDTLKIRESLFVARERAKNMLRAQIDVTNYAMRRRIYDTQRARNELQWQKQKMQENMDTLQGDLKIMGEQFADKVNAIKLAETRLENRKYRPGVELCSDDADIGLKQECHNLRESIKQLQENLDCAKATYNALENASIKIDMDLKEKEMSLDTDIKALEVRAALEPKKTTDGTDRNLILAGLADELPKTK